jgi:hypothetical protein
MRFILLFLFVCKLSFCFDGIEYKYLECVDGNACKIHILEIDPALYNIIPIKALDNGIGRESVLSISQRYGAVAAINGGFFSIGTTYDGRACGVLKINQWYALPSKPRGFIGWNAHEQIPIMDRLMVKVVINSTITIDGLNRYRKNGEVILFNACFNKTTLTDSEGEEIVIIDNVVVDNPKMNMHDLAHFIPDAVKLCSLGQRYKAFVLNLSSILYLFQYTITKCVKRLTKKSGRRCVGLKPRELPGLLGAVN